jgi:hypothetical protein
MAIASGLYYALVFVSVFFLVLPALLLAVRLSLVLPLMSIERRTMWSAFGESANLTHHRFWLIAKYMAVPTIAILAITLSPLLPYLQSGTGHDPIKWTEQPLATILVMVHLVSSFLSLVPLMMLTNVYSLCKEIG